MDGTSGITSVPRDASERERLAAVAKDLEGVFLRSLLSHARSIDLAEEDGPFARSAASDQFTELLHARLADEAAGKLGIAALIVRQLDRPTVAPEPPHAAP